MPFLALVLLLFAAVAHSVWNLLAKRASCNAHFVWFISVGESALLFPLALWAGARTWPHLDWRAATCLVSSGALELLYAKSLLQRYRVGELSVVYPIARGIGSLFACFGAIAILGERRSLRIAPAREISMVIGAYFGSRFLNEGHVARYDAEGVG